MSSKADDILLKRADYYSSHGVRVLKSVKITKVDVKNKVILSADQKFQYDKLFLGTGSRSVSPAPSPNPNHCSLIQSPAPCWHSGLANGKRLYRPDVS